MVAPGETVRELPIDSPPSVLATVITSVEPEMVRVETMLEADVKPILLAELSLPEVDCTGNALEIVSTVVEPKADRVVVATATSDDTVLLAKVPAAELEV